MIVIKTDNNNLTPKQEAFCHEYLKDFNATQAAIRANFSRKTAQQQSSRLLLNVVIQARLSELSKSHFEKVDTDAQDILREAARIAFSDVGQAFDENDCLKPISQIPEDVRRAISGIEVDEIWEFVGEGEELRKEKVGETKKVKFWSKDKQIEHLMKYLGLFAEDNKQTGEAAVNALLEVYGRVRGTKDTLPIYERRFETSRN